MGASQSANSTVTLESAIVENYLNKLDRLERQVTELSNKNIDLEEKLDGKVEEVDNLKKELQKSKQELKIKDKLISENTILRRISEESAIQGQTENNIFKNEIAKLQHLIADYEVRLKKKDEEIKSNKEKDNKRYNKLQSQTSKFQSELQQYKSQETIVELFKIQQQIQKIHSEADATRKKLNKEINPINRAANRKGLGKLIHEHDELISSLKKLNIAYENKFKIIREKYQGKCAENDKKTAEITRKVLEIEQAAKVLQTDLSKNIKEASALVENYTKVLFSLKQICLVPEFKEENKLYQEVVKVGKEEMADFQTKKSGKIKKTNLTKSKSMDLSKLDKPFNWKTFDLPNDAASSSKGENRMIVYNFPESDLKDQQEEVDLMRVKHFVRYLADDDAINDVKVQRLPISDGASVRPVLVNLPNEEIVNKVLTSPKNVMNIKVAKYDGPVKLA